MIKVCGIKDRATALTAIEAGATAIGLVFATSPRQVSPRQAAHIAAALPAHVLCVGVFRGCLFDDIRAVLQQVPLGAVQVHPDADCELPLKLDGVPLLPAGALAEVAALQHVLVLVDSPSGAGSGQAWDYALAAPLAARRPVVVAGGLHPGNVGIAVKAARPAGVDVSSGVERSRGEKDAGLVREFVREAARALRDLETEQAR